MQVALRLAQNQMVEKLKPVRINLLFILFDKTLSQKKQTKNVKVKQCAY